MLQGVRYIVPYRLSHRKRSAGCVEAEQVSAELQAGRGLGEGFERRLMTDEAVSPAIRATVTSAAAVMIGVFSIVATLSSLDFKEVGVGLAAAVLIDAAIVRAVLLPASMKPLVDRNFRTCRRGSSGCRKSPGSSWSGTSARGSTASCASPSSTRPRDLS